MLDIIAPAGPDALWTTLLLTIILGGAASAAAGRAARTFWVSPWSRRISARRRRAWAAVAASVEAISESRVSRAAAA